MRSTKRQLIIIAILSFCSIIACVPLLMKNNHNSAQRLQLAKDCIGKGDFWNPIFILRPITRNATGKVQFCKDAFFLTGKCFDTLGLIENAKDAYASALAMCKNGNDSIALREYSIKANFKLCAYDSVLTAIKNFERENVECSEYIKLINVVALYKKKQYSDAIKESRKIDTTGQIKCDAAMYCGLSYLALKDTDNAICQLSTSVNACSSGVPEACLNIGILKNERLLFNITKKDSSGCLNFQDFSLIHEESQFYEQAFVEICRGYLWQEKYDTLNAVIDTFLLNRPESPVKGELLFIKGYALRGNRKWKEGSNCFEKCFVTLHHDWPADSIKNSRMIDSLESIRNEYKVRINTMLFSGDKTINDSIKNEVYGNYAHFVDIAKRIQKCRVKQIVINTFSFRNEKLISDAIYALAHPHSHKMEIPVDRNDNTIDSELKKLKKNLKL